MWWIVASAFAHEPGLSRLVLEPRTVRFSLSRTDAADAGTLLAEARILSGGEPCALSTPTSAASGEDGTEATAGLSCSGDGPLEIDAAWLAELPPGHRTLVEREGRPVAWLDAQHARITLDGGGKTAGQVALDYLGLGVEHILTGYDHLLFLAGLLIGTRTLREALGVVTGFTLAHSVTLSLAALGVVSAPAWLVEPVIALTVVMVGLENLRERPAVRRVALTCTLGLVHGLGFAGLLGELGLPKDQLLTALVSFNGGVEVGQFCVVMLVLPLLLRLRQSEGWRGQGIRWASLVVSAVGLFWFVERVVGNLG
ncbi:MAG: HupE/UreJ family protein [Alphaproteobacteria bacterium]|nr:HupE/UreJ family protein [Alphaproteobacteria bacterium]MCB9696873.1 HupE/UreJ family protein [Alphaproteobacteria bacterium]